MGDKIEVYINGEKKMDKELTHIRGEEAVETIKMVLEYGELHKGSKIGMLKGLKGLR